MATEVDDEGEEIDHIARSRIQSSDESEIEAKRGRTTQAKGRNMHSVDLDESSNSSSSDSDSDENVNKGKRKTSGRVKVFPCGQCGEAFNSLCELTDHRQYCYPSPIPDIDRCIEHNICRELYLSSLRGAARSIRFTQVSGEEQAEEASSLPPPPMMPIDFFQNGRGLMDRTLAELRAGARESRVHAVLSLRMSR
jgi:hypothetical protein